MSAVEKINQLSHRIFNTSKNEQNTTRVSNPFAASNFQKNILTEDVFETSKPKNPVSFTGNLTAGSKRVYSAFVGSINDFGSKFYEGLENLKALCGKMKESLTTTFNKIQEYGNKEINVDGIKNAFKKDITMLFAGTREKEITKMAKMDPHTQLKPMLSDAISALSKDLEEAA